MADKKIGDYSLFGQSVNRKPKLSGVRYLEEGQKLTEGTSKGKGYFGEIPTLDGSVMTEYSSAFEVGDKTISYPLIVPTLTTDELNLLRTTGNVTPEIEKKAQQFALDRLAQGKNPFASPTELRYPFPEGFNLKIFAPVVNSAPIGGIGLGAGTQDNEMPDAVRQYMADPRYSDPFADTTR
jgi:hypothetical protein